MAITTGFYICCGLLWLMCLDKSTGNPVQDTRLHTDIEIPTFAEQRLNKRDVQNKETTKDGPMISKSRKKREVPGCDSICQYWDCTVDKLFIEELEGFETNGYVPKDNNGQPLGHSGVTIGNGIDLGTKNAAYFEKLCVSDDFVSKLEPYFGLQRYDAKRKLEEDPLSLTDDEAKDLSKRVMDSEICDAADAFDAAVRKLENVKLKMFRQLTIAQRTVISSVKFQHGSPTEFPKFWGHVTNQRWDDAINELRNFGDDYPTRRGKEADFLESDSGETNSCEDDPYSKLGFDMDGIKEPSMNIINDKAKVVADLYERSKQESRTELENEGKFNLNNWKAFWESLWMYFTTQEFGEYEARTFGDVYQRSMKDISRGERVKNLQNDRKGIDLALKHPGKSGTEVVKKALEEGELQIENYGDDLTIVSRTDWGARERTKTSTMLNPDPAYRVFIHHTAGSACTTNDTCVAAVRGIQKDHMDDNGWSDIGYNFLVGEDGNVYEGRGWRVLGAHTPPYNYYSYAISFIGNFTDVMPNDKAIKAAQNLIDYGMNHDYISEDYILRGHRDAKKTECPGKTFYNDVKTWTHYTKHRKVCDIIQVRFKSLTGVKISSAAITNALSNFYITDTGDLCNTKTEQQCAKDLASTASFFIGKEGAMYKTCGWEHKTNTNPESYTIRFIGNYKTKKPADKLLQRAMDLTECGMEKKKVTIGYSVKATNDIKEAKCTYDDGKKKKSLYCTIKEWPMFTDED